MLVTIQVLGTDDDDDDDVLRFAEGWQPVLRLSASDSVENLFQHMARGIDPSQTCAAQNGMPLLQEPLPKAGSWACTRIENTGDHVGIWRIDFEGAFGAGYRFEAVLGTERQLVLSYPHPEQWQSGEIVTAGRQVASLPIVIQPRATLNLFVRVDNPADLSDADPVLRPEAEFDQLLLGQAHGFGILIGAALLLLMVFMSIAKLVRSEPAKRFGVYFAAVIFAAISNAGYLNGLFQGNPSLPIGMFNKLLEAGQVVGHLLFMAAFVREGLPKSRIPKWLSNVGMAAGALLLLAAVGSFGIGGPAGALRYFDLGFELDPLTEDPFRSFPLLLGALVTVAWLVSIMFTSVYLVRRGVTGSWLFALGSGILAFGLLAASLGDDALDLFDDTTFGLQYVLLTDALIFAAAMVKQTFGLRDQRDQAVRHELQLTQEKVALAETLLEARRDSDRSRALAEKHRNRLALTGHDLRQPLTSLHLALSQAEKTNPELGDTLRASLDYIRSVLNATVTESKPEDISEDEGSYHTEIKELEPIEVTLLLSNAVRMFGEEARSKGLSLTYVQTDLIVQTVPVTIIRILSNLVSNAVKYTPEGGVTLQAQQTEDTVSIEVQDTGRGLSDQEIEHIQGNYARGSEAHAADGDGLGLSSAEAFASSLGLRLSIRSTLGEGSCFSINGLPVVRPKSST